MSQDAEVASPSHTSDISGQPDWTDNGNERYHPVSNPEICGRQCWRHNEASETAAIVASRLFRKSLHGFNGHIRHRRHISDGQKEYF